MACTWKGTLKYWDIEIHWNWNIDRHWNTGLKPRDIETLRHWNTGLVSSGASLTSWGEGAFLTLVGDPYSDSVTIKMPYGVDVLHWPASHPIFPIGLVKTESGFIVRLVETRLGRWTLVVAVISVDTYPFFWFSQPWPVTLRIQE